MERQNEKCVVVIHAVSESGHMNKADLQGSSVSAAQLGTLYEEKQSGNSQMTEIHKEDKKKLLQKSFDSIESDTWKIGNKTKRSANIQLAIDPEDTVLINVSPSISASSKKFKKRFVLDSIAEDVYEDSKFDLANVGAAANTVQFAEDSHQLFDPSATLPNMEAYGSFSSKSNYEYQNYYDFQDSTEETQIPSNFENTKFSSKGQSFKEKIKMFEDNVNSSSAPFQITTEKNIETLSSGFEPTEDFIKFYEEQCVGYTKELEIENINKEIDQIVLNYGKNFQDTSQLKNLTTDRGTSKYEPIHQEKPPNQIRSAAVPEKIYTIAKKDTHYDMKNLHGNTQESKVFKSPVKTRNIEMTRRSATSKEGNTALISNIQHYEWGEVQEIDETTDNGIIEKKQRKEKNSNALLRAQDVDVHITPRATERPTQTNVIEAVALDEIRNQYDIQQPQEELSRVPGNRSRNTTAFFLNIHYYFELICPFFGFVMIFACVGLIFYFGRNYTTKQTKRLN